MPEESQALSREQNDHLHGIRLVLVTIGVTLMTFLLLLDQSILSTAVPQITSAFHSLPDVGWYNGAYSLAAAALQPLTGKLFTHLPVKHVFLAHVFVFELGSLLCGVANSSSMLIGGRAIAGLGAAGLMNGGLNIIGVSVPASQRPLYFGMVFGIGQLGLVSGPLIGGALTEHATWRWCFYLNLPIGAITATVITLVHIPEPITKAQYSFALAHDLLTHKLDLIGFFMFAPACIMLLLALQFGANGSHSWDSPTVIGLFVGAGVTAVIFIAWEARVGEKAMIPGSLFNNRILLASMGNCIGLGACVFVGSLWVPTYFQSVRGASPTQSGVNVLPMILSQILLAIVSGAAVSKLGYYLPWAVFSGVATTVGFGLMSTLSTTTVGAKWIGYLIIVGAGRGAGMQMSITAAQAALPAKLLPISLAFFIFLQNLIAAIFNVVANAIFTTSLEKQLAHYAPSVSPQEAFDAGSSAAAVRKLIPKDKPWELEGVLMAYNESLRNIWYMLVAFAFLAFVSAWGMGWIDMRKDEKEPERIETGDLNLEKEKKKQENI